jgi:hypothetical protein
VPLTAVYLHVAYIREPVGRPPHPGLMKSWACCLDFAIPHPTRFVARRCVGAALKGPNRIAQGNALGIDGELYESALKGRDRICCTLSGYCRRRRIGTVRGPGSPGVARGFPVWPLQGRKHRHPCATEPAGASDQGKPNFSSAPPTPPFANSVRHTDLRARFHSLLTGLEEADFEEQVMTVGTSKRQPEAYWCGGSGF